LGSFWYRYRAPSYQPNSASPIQHNHGIASCGQLTAIHPCACFDEINRHWQLQICIRLFFR